MKLPLNWLRDFCDPGLPASELAERLALTGTEVDRIHAHGVGEADLFIVGRVLSCERHPQADRLSVCMVATGEGDTSQIVCGAPNVAVNQTVAVALPGAVMPDGSRLGKAKLRGVESSGMILSEDEIGLGADHSGIMVLDDDLVPGTPLSDVMPIATEVLELEITPNRPDCLAVYGIAREVHAATGARLAPPPWGDDPGSEGDVPGCSVDVQAPDLCPRFTLRLFEDVTIGPSPQWLKARLMAAGQRPISNVVDITNYVMLVTGQPMHAFDADRVAGGRLVVRRGGDGEKMTTLDDVERTLDTDVCVIDDADGPTSIAGIMGGARSEVGENTTRVLMEAATWNGPNIKRSSGRLGLRTEASSRFEKQLSAQSAIEGQILAAKLMVELCGARIAGGTIDVQAEEGQTSSPIRLRDAMVVRLLGLEIERAESAEILTRLGFEVSDALDGLDVSVPHWRRDDVTREADLIEEVARLAGLDRLPATLPARRGAAGRIEPAQRARRRAEDALVGSGFFEAVGWSFAAPDVAARLRLAASDARANPVRLTNPMSEDQSILRTTLLASLLDSLRRNRSRGAVDVRLFEYGTVFLPSGPSAAPVAESAAGGGRDALLPDERPHLAAVVTGALRPASWRESQPPAGDFFAAKGVLAGVFAALRVPWTVERATEPFLHPGRAAAVIVGGERAGWIGELHPAVAGAWDLDRVAAFEVAWEPVARAAGTSADYQDLTSLPSVRQDLAVVVPEDTSAEQVVSVIRQAGGKLLAQVEVFDVYRGAQVGEGKTSLALRLEFRAPDRTLTDDEVNTRREKIARTLSKELGGELRG